MGRHRSAAQRTSVLQFCQHARCACGARNVGGECRTLWSRPRWCDGCHPRTDQWRTHDGRESPGHAYACKSVGQRSGSGGFNDARRWSAALLRRTQQRGSPGVVPAADRESAPVDATKPCRSSSGWRALLRGQQHASERGHSGNERDEQLRKPRRIQCDGREPDNLRGAGITWIRGTVFRPSSIQPAEQQSVGKQLWFCARHQPSCAGGESWIRRAVGGLPSIHPAEQQQPIVERRRLI